MSDGVYIAATRAPNRRSWEHINGGDGTYGRALGALAAFADNAPNQPRALLVRMHALNAAVRKGEVIPQETVDNHAEIALAVQSYLATCELKGSWIERKASDQELAQHPDLAAWQPLSDVGTETFTHGYWEALRGLPHPTVRWMVRGRDGRIRERACMSELRSGSSSPGAHQVAATRCVGPAPSPDTTGPRRSQARGRGVGRAP